MRAPRDARLDAGRARARRRPELDGGLRRRRRQAAAPPRPRAAEPPVERAAAARRARGGDGDEQRERGRDARGRDQRVVVPLFRRRSLCVPSSDAGRPDSQQSRRLSAQQYVVPSSPSHVSDPPASFCRTPHRLTSQHRSPSAYLRAPRVASTERASRFGTPRVRTCRCRRSSQGAAPPPRRRSAARARASSRAASRVRVRPLRPRDAATGPAARDGTAAKQFCHKIATNFALHPPLP